ncbi:sigma 54-interacting transcriptional regulator [Thermovorax subterraneus]|nr:sigma 54-interacting transcriptional regulator [Thermovorax subterraneus]
MPVKILSEMINSIEIILNHVHEGIVIADRDGKVLYVNEANERITGLENSKILGKYVKDVAPESSIPEVIKTGKEKLGVKTRVNDRYVISNIVPIKDKESDELIGAISVFLDITELETLNARLMKAQEKINKLSLQLSSFIGNEEPIIGKNAKMQKAFSLALKAANVNSNVLIIGESGTGKEVVAKFIHEKGTRKNKPFVAVNCGAIPENLLESELFGYEAGAFTGASSKGKPGLFEQANGGTIFLDEIGDMPFALQVKLLRVLQEKEIMRVGGTQKIKLDVRVIAATNRDIETMVKEKKFREDLYYRLNVIKIDLPPLRERKEDLPLYISYFLNKLSSRLGKEKPKVTSSAMKLLLNYDYPGNIRELENILEKSLIIDDDGSITVEDLPEYLLKGNTYKYFDLLKERWPKLYEIEKSVIEESIRVFKNKTKVAEILGIPRSTLYRKIKEYGIKC